MDRCFVYVVGDSVLSLLNFDLVRQVDCRFRCARYCTFFFMGEKVRLRGNEGYSAQYLY